MRIQNLIEERKVALAIALRSTILREFHDWDDEMMYDVMKYMIGRLDAREEQKSSEIKTESAHHKRNNDSRRTTKD